MPYLDSNGEVVVKYVYNAWGNHEIVAENGMEINSGIGVHNPLRYRGYSIYCSCNSYMTYFIKR